MRGSVTASLIMRDDSRVSVRDHTSLAADPFVVLAVAIDGYSGANIHVRAQHLAGWQAAVDEARRLLIGAGAAVKAA